MCHTPLRGPQSSHQELPPRAIPKSDQKYRRGSHHIHHCQHPPTPSSPNPKPSPSSESYTSLFSYPHKARSSRGIDPLGADKAALAARTTRRCLESSPLPSLLT